MRTLRFRLLGGSTLLALALTIPAWAQDQKPLPAAPKGFDQKREGIPRGKVETIEYDSKAIGGKRKMVVYTPSTGGRAADAVTMRFAVSRKWFGDAW